MKTTITISINIAAANKYEGNTEIKLNILENELDACKGNYTGIVSENRMNNLIYKAMKEYKEKN